MKSRSEKNQIGTVEKGGNALYFETWKENKFSQEKGIIELTIDEPDIFFAPPNPKKVLVINYNRQKRSSRGTGKAIRCSIMHKNPLKRG